MIDLHTTSLESISHNGRLKIYPDGYCRVSVASGLIFREAGWELADKWESDPSHELSDPEKDPARKKANLDRAKRRAKTAVFDLALSNDFQWFVTLTLDRTKVNRYDVTEVTRKLNNWLDNHVRRSGLRYVLVPELHKDSAIHFHGFFSASGLEAVDSGALSPPGGGRPRKAKSKAERARMIAEGWHPIYNLPAWTLGFTTAIPLYGDKRQSASYAAKYITKAGEKVGGRWYYSGGDLVKPDVVFFDGDFEEALLKKGACRYQITGLGVDVVSYEIGGETYDR